MNTIIEHPIYFLLLIPVFLLRANWWYIAFIYSDVKKRGIKNKIGWSILAFFLGSLMMPIYNAKTLRPQTGLTSTVTGVVSGEKLENVGKKGKLIWAVIFLGLFLIMLMKPFSYDSFTTFFASKNADGYLYVMVGLIVLFLYSISSIFQKGKLNPMDKPLFGAVEETSQGYLIDTSLTKYKKKVFFWIVFIIVAPILAFIFYPVLSTLWHNIFPTTNENNYQEVSITLKTYTDTKNGFEFNYPSEEIVTESAVSKDDLGKKIIYIEIINSKDGFTCISGEDVRCKNIVAGNHNIVVQYSMSGNINASTDLLNGKSVLLSLSCDSFDSNPNLIEGYCIVSDQRQEMFDNLLSGFKYIK